MTYARTSTTIWNHTRTTRQPAGGHWGQRLVAVGALLLTVLLLLAVWPLAPGAESGPPAGAGAAGRAAGFFAQQTPGEERTSNAEAASPAVEPAAEAAPEPEPEAAGPNVVFILIDDLGWADLPCYGNKFHETPNIDRLAREGMRFTNFYAASPVCSSTRASIHSGQYPARVGITNFIPGHYRPYARLTEPPILNALPLEITTLAEALKSAGYRTGHFGKWHLGGKGHGPLEQGYDVDVPGADPQLLTDRVLEFIEANKDRPFFVDLSHRWVHIPLRAEPEAVRKYAAKPKPAKGVNNPAYAAMIEAVDRSVGRILARLEELDLDEETLVIFTSDNGGLYRRFDGQGPVVTTNEPLRAEKGTLYEGGIRVPLIVWLPGVVPEGTVCDEPTISMDFYPTLLEVCGAEAPQGQVLDGVSLVPLLRQTGKPNREALYFHYPHYHHSRPAGAIRAGKWKLIEFYDDGSVELYDLEEDIGETHNLAAEMTDKAIALRARLSAWRQAVGAKMPKPNPNFDPQREGQWGRRR